MVPRSCDSDPPSRGKAHSALRTGWKARGCTVVTASGVIRVTAVPLQRHVLPLQASGKGLCTRRLIQSSRSHNHPRSAAGEQRHRAMGPLIQSLLRPLRPGVSIAVRLQSPCPERPIHREAQRGRLTCRDHVAGSSSETQTHVFRLQHLHLAQGLQEPRRAQVPGALGGKYRIELGPRKPQRRRGGKEAGGSIGILNPGRPLGPGVSRTLWRDVGS